MDWTEFGVQWLHILVGTFWFGGILFSNFVVIPAIMRLPVGGQAAAAHLIGEQANRIIPWFAIATIVLGVVRGTVFGEVKDVSALGTAYGIEWLVGLVAAVATFAWGMWVVGPAAEHMTAGGQAAATAAAIARVRLFAVLELFGFLVIFTTMILMHFASEG